MIGIYAIYENLWTVYIPGAVVMFLIVTLTLLKIHYDEPGHSTDDI